MIDIQKIAKNLHHLNFNSEDGIICPSKVFNGDIASEDYSFDCIQENIENNKPAHGYGNGYNYCKECKKYADCILFNGINDLEEKGKKEVYHFTNITHGSHTLDFLSAHNRSEKDIKDWSTKPVMFVMENPGSYEGDGYFETEDRYLCRWWYWINGQGIDAQDSDFKYPKYFVQKEYGWMLYSVINTFKIANAYITNMVKCGIGSASNKYKTTEYYNQDIVDTCIERYLFKELDILREGNPQTAVTIFAFGQNTYNTLYEKLNDKNCAIYLLPHPANRLANDYRKYVLAGKIMRGLLQTDFYEGKDGAKFEKPELEDLLFNDKNDNKKEDVGEEYNIDIEELFKKFSCERGIKFEKEAEYTPGVYGYALKYESPKSNRVKSISLWHTRNEAEKSLPEYRMCWCDYNFDTMEIRLFKNYPRAKKHCECIVCEGQEQYEVFKLLINFLKDKLQIESPIIIEGPK